MSNRKRTSLDVDRAGRSKRKAGRPTKADLEERARLKAKAAEDDEVRAIIEESIAKGEDVSDIVFPAPPLSSPWKALLLDRLRGLKGVTDKQFEDAAKAAAADLLRSDLELDPKSRREVFDFYARTDEQKRLSKDRAFIIWFEDLKNYYCGRGMTAIEAETFIASTRGWKHGTLLKNLQRARKRLRKAEK